MSMTKKSNWNLGCSLVLVVVIVASFLFYLWAQKLGKYTLQPGESVNFTVNPRIQDVEYYSELILKKKDTNSLKLSGSGVWFEMLGDIFYDVEGQTLVRSHHSEDADEELPNNQKGIHLVHDGIVVSYQGEKVFNVTNNKPYTITITNVDDKPANFEARVVDR